MLVLIIKLYGNFLWSEPDIELISYPKNAYANDVFFKSAILEVYNREELPITNCFATLEFANDISVDENNHVSVIPLIPSFTKKADRIKWEEELDTDESCEITIPPDKSKHINVASLLGTLRYHLRDGDFEARWAVHTVKIRIDGYFNKKSMKPLSFDGYIYATNLENAEEEFSRNGKVRSNEETIASQIRNLILIFREGDWKKDEEIKNKMNVSEYK